jgi:glycosyltransferase involved in cell wall biosynthesis
MLVTQSSDTNINRPFFTVLICNYNYEEFIRLAIQSVLDQSFPDFELVIVDDGSTDSSRNIINSFSDPRIKSVFKENGGQCSAFKAGISIAEGSYIALLDSDDEWKSTKLARCASVLREHPDICFLQNSMEIIDGDRTQFVADLSCCGFYDPFPDYSQLKHHDLPFQPTSCITGITSAFKKLILDDEAWRIDADTPVIAGLSVLGPTYLLNEPLTRYRKHGSNATKETTWQEMLERRKRFYRSINDHLSLVGKSERFQFENSREYILGQIASTKWYWVQGFWSRLRYRFLLR